MKRIPNILLWLAAILFTASLAMCQTSLITGTVKAPDGTPWQTTVEFLSKSTPVANGTITIPTKRTVLTATNGTFTQALFPGSYAVTIKGAAGALGWPDSSFYIAVTTNLGTYDITALMTNTLSMPSYILGSKGSIYVYNGTNVTGLAAGSNGQALTADSTTATGLKWASTAGLGTVTSIGATSSHSGLTISNSPITSSGELGFFLHTNLQNWSSVATSAVVYPSQLGTAAYSNATVFQAAGTYAAPSITNGLAHTNWLPVVIQGSNTTVVTNIVSGQARYTVSSTATGSGTTYDPLVNSNHFEVVVVGGETVAVGATNTIIYSAPDASDVTVNLPASPFKGQSVIVKNTLVTGVGKTVINAVVSSFDNGVTSPINITVQNEAIWLVFGKGPFDDINRWQTVATYAGYSIGSATNSAYTSASNLVFNSTNAAYTSASNLVNSATNSAYTSASNLVNSSTNNAWLSASNYTWNATNAISAGSVDTNVIATRAFLTNYVESATNGLSGGTTSTNQEHMTFTNGVHILTNGAIYLDQVGYGSGTDWARGVISNTPSGLNLGTFRAGSATTNSMPLNFWTDNTNRAFFNQFGHFYPNGDNIYDLGKAGAGNRWRNIYAYTSIACEGGAVSGVGISVTGSGSLNMNSLSYVYADAKGRLRFRENDSVTNFFHLSFGAEDALHVAVNTTNLGTFKIAKANDFAGAAPSLVSDPVRMTNWFGGTNTFDGEVQLRSNPQHQYLSTNAPISNGTNLIYYLNWAAQRHVISNHVYYVHSTNGPTDTNYASFTTATFINNSGSDYILTLPAGWTNTASSPASPLTITNGTIRKMQTEAIGNTNVIYDIR